MPRAWLIGGLIACALFAGGVSLFSSDPLHRLWGLSGACAYAVAALAVLAWRSRATFGVDVALTAVICGAILIPLLWMAARPGAAGGRRGRQVRQDADQAGHPVQKPKGARRHHRSEHV